MKQNVIADTSVSMTEVYDTLAEHGKRWGHLPNAQYIDRILNLIRQRPDNWDKAWNSSRTIQRGRARLTAWNQAHERARDQDRKLEWFAVCSEAWDAIWNKTGAYDDSLDLMSESGAAAWVTHIWEEEDGMLDFYDDKSVDSVAYDSALFAFMALITFDEAGEYFNMSSTELKIWAALSEDPAAVLLLPIVYVREKLNDYT